MSDGNPMVWDRRPGHYEVWYATLTHRASQTGFWIRYTLEAPALGGGEAYAQLWFARFDGADPSRNFGIHRRFAIAELHAEARPFSLRIGESAIEEQPGKVVMRGAIQGGGHDARWSIEWPPARAAVRWLPGFAYKSKIASTKVLSPHLDVAARGEITVDGQRYALEGEPLGQTHLWGKKHAYAWGWGHCTAFDGGGAALEALAVRLKRGSVILPTLTVATVLLDGEELAFREPWMLPLARGSFATGRFTLRAASATARIEAEFRCAPDEMLLTEYVDPDGDPAFCHNCCAADARLTVWRRSLFGGWREQRRLEARRGGHFEWGARAGDAAQVKRVHQDLG
jgi:hypothetical protein